MQCTTAVNYWVIQVIWIFFTLIRERTVTLFLAWQPSAAARSRAQPAMLGRDSKDSCSPFRRTLRSERAFKPISRSRSRLETFILASDFEEWMSAILRQK